MINSTVRQQERGKTATIRLVVKGRPVPKSRPRLGLKGRTAYVYTPEKTKSYQQLVGWVARKKCRKPLEGPVAVFMRLYSMGRYDLDNVAKSILDGMNKICYQDDEQVVLLVVSKEKVDDEKEERAEVEVMPFKACETFQLRKDDKSCFLLLSNQRVQKL